MHELTSQTRSEGSIYQFKTSEESKRKQNRAQKRARSVFGRLQVNKHVTEALFFIVIDTTIR